MSAIVRERQRQRQTKKETHRDRQIDRSRERVWKGEKKTKMHSSPSPRQEARQ